MAISGNPEAHPREGELIDLMREAISGNQWESVSIIVESVAIRRQSRGASTSQDANLRTMVGAPSRQSSRCCAVRSERLVGALRISSSTRSSMMVRSCVPRESQCWCSFGVLRRLRSSAEPTSSNRFMRERVLATCGERGGWGRRGEHLHAEQPCHAGSCVGHLGHGRRAHRIGIVRVAPRVLGNCTQRGA